MKIIWTVSPVPTGQYRSFYRRGWPDAQFETGDYAATLNCNDEYIPSKIKNGDHGQITVRVALHGKTTKDSGLVTGVLKHRAATLKEAKKLVADFYAQHPQHMPKREN